MFNGEADFADQALRLADPTVGNCKILVDDITYFAEPMFPGRRSRAGRERGYARGWESRSLALARQWGRCLVRVRE
ncbi:MAG: hypothetical protein WKG07_12425 [Hymenobacter sp.]